MKTIGLAVIFTLASLYIIAGEDIYSRTISWKPLQEIRISE